MVGDCYIVSCGILAPDSEGFKAVDTDHNPVDSARRVYAFAKDMLRVSRKVNRVSGADVALKAG